MNTKTQTSATAELIDITAFDIVGACETGHSFELRNPDGSTTGISVIVLGGFAPEVVAWSASITEKFMNEQRMAQRKGKSAKPKTTEELKAQNIDGAVVRVSGWTGVRQTFTPELLRAALNRNPHWVAQIVDESENLGNFGTTSASS